MSALIPLLFALFAADTATTVMPQPDMATILAAESSVLDSAHTRQLALEIEGLAFFKDNEYDGEQVKGYTLPGFWLRPRLTYQPIDAVRLELGLHAMIFDGANKYPCYVYHDIGHWKGNQYQRGAHVLPFFRATAVWGKTTFVLGDIYGGAAHGLMEPMFSPEVNLTQDPEMGFQLLHRSSRYSLDAWINWQSYIFKEDTHQEAFTVGLVQRVRLSRRGAALQWFIPIDILVQHRGGEQDQQDLHLGVQTICNGAAGLALRWQPERGILRQLDADVLALGAWQQSGDLWPFDVGGAGAASVSALWRGDVRVFARVVAGRNFVPLYGSPFFSSYSQKSGGSFHHFVTPQVGVEWSHTFAKDYVLGLKAETYLASVGRLTQPDGTVLPSAFSNNFSFGVFFRCRPRFRLFSFGR